MSGSRRKIFHGPVRFDLMQFGKLALTLLGLAIIWNGCDKPGVQVDDSRLNLSFSSRYGSLPFQTLQPYSYGTVRSVKISKLDFFVTGITLLSASGNVKLEAASLVDITGNTDQDRTIALNGLKSGDYTGIRFKLGVVPDLNKKLPKDFRSDQALSSTSHYWEAWNSYIFSKIEGVLDTKGDKVYDLGFAVHTGTDACVEEVTINKTFSLTDVQPYSLNLDLDVEQIFLQAGQYFDLETSPLNHNPSNISTLKLFAIRLAGAIQLKN